MNYQKKTQTNIRIYFVPSVFEARFVIFVSNSKLRKSCISEKKNFQLIMFCSISLFLSKRNFQKFSDLFPVFCGSQLSSFKIFSYIGPLFGDEQVFVLLIQRRDLYEKTFIYFVFCITKVLGKKQNGLVGSKIIYNN